MLPFNAETCNNDALARLAAECNASKICRDRMFAGLREMCISGYSIQFVR
eukprot:m.807853 g.807853  ORF g.807853 m.807853 type:complete len:50 (+) comp59308_c0_seq8:621-770(+)